MDPINLNFPNSVFINPYNELEFDLDRPLNNIVNVNGTDYIPYYIDLATKGNKGGNSNLLSLHSAQDFEDVGFSKPLMAIKISKTPLTKWGVNKNKRFEIETDALVDCLNKELKNVVKIYNRGECNLLKRFSDGRVRVQTFSFYTLEFAKFDLKKYMESFSLTLYEKINLCIEIANGLKELDRLNYYHRDLKPDNIFIIDDSWKIGDLGLIGNRETDYKLDRENELIGPRGWYCPEAMNKFLTEGKGFKFKFDCKIDHQSDIFQLGKVFWYILQGNSPEGSVKLNDFFIHDFNLFAILRTMLNHSKKRRYLKIDEVIKLLKPIHYKYFKTAS